MLFSHGDTFEVCYKLSTNLPNLLLSEKVYSFDKLAVLQFEPVLRMTTSKAAQCKMSMKGFPSLSSLFFHPIYILHNCITITLLTVKAVT